MNPPSTPLPRAYWSPIPDVLPLRFLLALRCISQTRQVNLYAYCLSGLAFGFRNTTPAKEKLPPQGEQPFFWSTVLTGVDFPSLPLFRQFFRCKRLPTPVAAVSASPYAESPDTGTERAFPAFQIDFLAGHVL